MGFPSTEFHLKSTHLDMFNLDLYYHLLSAIGEISPKQDCEVTAQFALHVFLSSDITVPGKPLSGAYI